MQKSGLLYEGKAKKVYSTDNPSYVIVRYKDDATAFDGKKRGVIQNKGIMNNVISNHFFKLLEKNGVRTHFVRQLSDRETLVKKVDIIPVEVIVRNVAAGSLCKRLGLEEGSKLKRTVLEYCYKNDSLGDPMINEYHIYAMELADPEEMETIASESFKINDILLPYLKGLHLDLIDFKLEFGRCGGDVLLADEISPDTCRFWDSSTQEKLDKDRFRRDLGNVERGYREILRRIAQESDMPETSE